ncbi:MAG: hypothetical protein JNM74_16965, partial [Myxococcales bacterium]|nr:hypothetical protein [Myxococcales bacterium]
MTNPEKSLLSLRAPVARAERRMRLGRALASFATTLAVALGAAIVALALRKAGVLPEKATRIALGLLAASPFVVALVFALRKLPPRAGAVALDKHHALSDRIASALSFAELPAAERTA